MKEFWYSPLNEWKHYIGWFFTSSAIVLSLLFFFSQISFRNFAKFFLPVFIPLVVVDYLNHKWWLQ